MEGDILETKITITQYLKNVFFGNIIYLPILLSRATDIATVF